MCCISLKQYKIIHKALFVVYVLLKTVQFKLKVLSAMILLCYFLLVAKVEKSNFKTPTVFEKHIIHQPSSSS